MKSEMKWVRTIVGMLVLGVSVDAATTNYWRGADGDWGTASNWSEQVVPDAGTIVVFDDPQYELEVNLPDNQDVAGLVFKDTMTSSVTIGGANNLIFRDGGVIIDVERGSAAHTINADIGVEGEGAERLSTLQNNSMQRFTIGAGMQRAGSVSPNLLFLGSGDFFFTGGGFVRQDMRHIDLGGTFTGQVIIDADYELRNTHPLTIDGGTLLVDGRTATRNNSTGLAVKNGLLTGHGVIGHILTGIPDYSIGIHDGGMVNPGRPGETGLLAFHNFDVAFDVGSTLRLDFADHDNYDRLSFAQSSPSAAAKVPALSLATDGPGVALELNLLPGFTAAIHDEFTILGGYEDINGYFHGLADGTNFTAGDYQFQIRYGQEHTVLTVMPEPTRLVENGRSQAAIVIDDHAPLSAVLAVQVLNRYLQASTGARLEVKRAGTIEGSTLDPDRNWVLIGDSRFLRDFGIDPSKLPYGAFVIKAEGSILAIAGRDYPQGATADEAVPEAVVKQAGIHSVFFYEQRINLDDTVEHYWNSGGTLYGVYHFLESELGIRWLWPGRTGTVIPRHDSLHVAAQQVEQAPAMELRRIRNHQSGRGYEEFHAGAFGFGPGVVPRDRRHIRYEHDEWFRANRLGWQRQFRGTHAFNQWADRFWDDHPEYFAYDHVNETRQPYNRVHAKLCKTEPGVVDQVVRDARRALDRSPHRWTESVSPGDGHSRGNCMCDGCVALDPADGPPVTLESGSPRREEFDHVSLTDRHVNWWNRIADRIKESHPDRFIASWAYGPYRHPPVHESLRDNVIIGFVGYNWVDAYALERDRAIWQGWAEKATHLMLRPNAFFAGGAFPLNYAREIARDMRTCYETGMLGFDGGDLIGHWSTQGLNYYVLARALWDPALDYDAVLQDYCESGFGPAAEQVRAYFDLLERMTVEVQATLGALSREDRVWASRPGEDLATHPPLDVDSLSHGRSRRIVPREQLRPIAWIFLAYETRLRALLEAGRAELGEDDGAYQDRLDFLVKGLDYAHLESRVFDGWFQAEREEVLTRLRERNEFLESIAADYIVHVPFVLRRHDRFGLTTSFYEWEAGRLPEEDTGLLEFMYEP